MASRVVYGLASRGQLPALFARVQKRTRTPVIATLAVAAVVLTLALAGTLSGLAEATSAIMLTIFALANLALWRLKRRDDLPPAAFTIPRWVPLVGFLVCAAFALRTLLTHLG